MSHYNLRRPSINVDRELTEQEQNEIANFYESSDDEQNAESDNESDSDYIDPTGNVDFGFSCKRKCNRWPMVIFHNMIDVAGLASFRLFELSHPAWNARNRDKRKLFLKELARELANEHLENRCKAPVTGAVKLAMDLIGFKAKNMTVIRSMPEIQVNTARRRCDFCKGTQSKDNKTSGVCDHCLKPTCPIHYVRACENCYLIRYKDPDTVGNDDDEDNDDDNDDNTPSTSAQSPSIPMKRRRFSTINL